MTAAPRITRVAGPLALVTLAIAAILSTTSLSPPLSAQTNPADPVRTPVMQNDTLSVTHLRFGPGTREVVHTHPFPIILVQITPGEISVQEQNTVRRGGKVGEVWSVPTGQPHALTAGSNITKAIDVLVVALMPERPPAPSAPATDAPAGITRATLVDNDYARVVRVRFSPGAREPMHAHPNDLLTIQLTRGQVDVTMGTAHQSQDREPGFLHFVPRNVQHAYVSDDTKPFELLSIAVK